jgi:hypothetical protein
MPNPTTDHPEFDYSAAVCEARACAKSCGRWVEICIIWVTAHQAKAVAGDRSRGNPLKLKTFQ